MSGKDLNVEEMSSRLKQIRRVLGTLQVQRKESTFGRYIWPGGNLDLHLHIHMRSPRSPVTKVEAVAFLPSCEIALCCNKEQAAELHNCQRQSASAWCI